MKKPGERKKNVSQSFPGLSSFSLFRFFFQGSRRSLTKTLFRNIQFWEERASFNGMKMELREDGWKTVPMIGSQIATERTRVL